MENDRSAMTAPAWIKRVITLSIVSFSFLVIFSAFPSVHDHEFDGDLHRDCVACLLFLTAIALTAVFVFSACAAVTRTIRPRRAVCAPVLVPRENSKRAPPFLLA
ncbi:MAG: hypothetical protein WC674_01205 [Candidatus Krumholzibacteriia bacterium]